MAALVKFLNKKAEGLTSVSLCCHHRGNGSLGASGQALRGKHLANDWPMCMNLMGRLTFEFRIRHNRFFPKLSESSDIGWAASSRPSHSNLLHLRRKKLSSSNRSAKRAKLPAEEAARKQQKLKRKNQRYAKQQAAGGKIAYQETEGGEAGSAEQAAGGRSCAQATEAQVQEAVRRQGEGRGRAGRLSKAARGGEGGEAGSEGGSACPSIAEAKGKAAREGGSACPSIAVAKGKGARHRAMCSGHGYKVAGNACTDRHDAKVPRVYQGRLERGARLDASRLQPWEDGEQQASLLRRHRGASRRRMSPLFRLGRCRQISEDLAYESFSTRCCLDLERMPGLP